MEIDEIDTQGLTSNLISSICWVPKGVSRAKPLLSVDQISSLVEMNLAMEEEEQQSRNKKTPQDSKIKIKTDSEIIAEYGLDTYDDEMEADPMPTDMFYDKPGLDPFLMPLNDTGDGLGTGLSDEEEEDQDDYRIKPEDGVFLATRSDEEISRVEVYVYERADNNLYIHHDFMLPTFPLCSTWGSVAPSSKSGSFAAIGTFNPGIEIWNLDVMDSLFPVSILGGTVGDHDDLKRGILGLDEREENLFSKATTGKKNSKKNKARREKELAKLQEKELLVEGSHSDAVLSLDWNNITQVLSSGSADCTIKLWDVETSTNTSTFDSHHSDKVQSVSWNPVEANILASGAFDKTIVICDIRSPNNRGSFKVNGEVEAMEWNPLNPQYLFVSDDSGDVTCVDIRALKAKDFKLLSFNAHLNKAATCLSFCPAPETLGMLLATGGEDSKIKLWDLGKFTDTSNKTPECIDSYNQNLGKLFGLSFSNDDKWSLAAAGSRGIVKVWDISEESKIQKKYKIKGRRTKGIAELVEGNDEAMDDDSSDDEE